MLTIIEDAVVSLDPVCERGGAAIEVRLTAVEGTLDDAIVVSHADGGRRSNLVIIENRGGKLVCLVWAHKTADDPTHEIEIEPAQYEEAADDGGSAVEMPAL